MKECEDPDFVFISPKELAARRVETDRDDDDEEEEEEEDDAEEEDDHNGLNGGKDRPKQKAARKRSADDGASAPKRKKTVICFPFSSNTPIHLLCSTRLQAHTEGNTAMGTVGGERDEESRRKKRTITYCQVFFFLLLC